MPTGRLEIVGHPGACPRDTLATRCVEETVGKKVDERGVDVEIWRDLPFGLKIQHLPQKSLVVRITCDDRHPRRLIETVMGILPPKAFDACHQGEIRPRLDLDTRIDVHLVHCGLDAGFGKMVVLGEQC